MIKPSYLDQLASGELEKKVRKLSKMLSNCVLCPHQCQVNRLAGEEGYCRTLANPTISGASPHFGEENVLVGEFGSGTIFFSNCNLSCVFCQNYEISYCGEGDELNTTELASLMLNLQKRRCHNINLVSPGHIIPQIVEAIFYAAKAGLKIPIVYNTNGYDLTDSLKYLDGIVDIYMPDLKFANDQIAEKYLGVKEYFSIAQAAIKEMQRQVGTLKLDKSKVAYQGLMIRHLVMPENLADSQKIMKFIAEEISPDTFLNIMAQYYPAHKAFQFPELSRKISEKEFQAAIKTAKNAGLKNLHY